MNNKYSTTPAMIFGIVIGVLLVWRGQMSAELGFSIMSTQPTAASIYSLASAIYFVGGAMIAVVPTLLWLILKKDP